ncbi:uncharacterized protein LOC101220555 [Cucumis sativus]|uniref:Uncharacterized protein n=1 Tax=Cucumis sativus TaxID=3659 RepID=A0A0A0KVZ1_CUCSA|nr:uncharacterized protein LOC101220555 [Cucumis sativus]
MGCSRNLMIFIKVSFKTRIGGGKERARARARKIMGISASKRVRNSLTNSHEFDSACNSTFSHCLALTQHAYNGVFPYQLCTAADHLHHLLTVVQPHPLITNWLPSPPTRLQVDSALRAVNRDDSDREDEALGLILFNRWAIELFAEAVVKNVGKKVMVRVPVGIAGIAGIGAVTRSGKDVVGTVVAVYALGVATSVYLSLSG